MPEKLSISQPVAHHQHRTLEKCKNMSVRMSTQKQIFTALISLLAMQLTAASPLWTFDNLFVSEDEDLVRNIEHAKMRRAAEPLRTSTKSSATTCAVIIGANLPPRAFDDSYKTFAKVLVRDSREATRNKLRELKALVTDKQVNKAYIFIMLDTFNDVDVTREGQSLHNELKKIVHKPNKDNENLFEDTSWFDKIIDNILCLVLNAKAEQNMVDNLVENYSMLDEISTHFDLFKKFWLDYRTAKKALLEYEPLWQRNG